MAREFDPGSLPPEEPPGQPIDPICGHRHPPGVAVCWAISVDEEPCIHAPRCRFCGGSMTMIDEHELEPGPPTNSRIHAECLVSEALGHTHQGIPIP